MIYHCFKYCLSYFSVFRSRQISWYVGEVVTFLVHKHGNEVFHLAALSLVEASDMDKYGFSIVTCYAGDKDKKIFVCDVKDIINPVGFLLFNDNNLQ